MALRTLFASFDGFLKPAKPRKPAAINIAAHADLVALWNWGRLSELLGHEALSIAAVERDDWWWSQEWLTPAEARSAHKNLAKVPGFSATLVPIATDDAGNYTCHDATTGKLVDWDHETRKPRKLSGSLTAILTQIGALLTTAKAPTAKPTTPVTVPKAIRVATSAILRKIDAIHKRGYDAAQLTGDATLFAGLVYGSHGVYFGDLTTNTELCPSEPELLAQKRAQGYVMMYGSGLACDGTTVVWRTNGLKNVGGQLSVWTWDGSVLALTGAARWSKSAARFHDTTMRLGGGWLACTAEIKDKTVIAAWPLAAFPRATTLAKATKELAPVVVIRAADSPHVALDPAGALVVVDAGTIARWESGKRVAHAKLGDLEVADLAVSPDGNRTFVLAREDELVELDRALAIVKRVKVTPAKRYGTSVRFGASGAWFVTANRDLKQGGELVVWNAATFKAVARLAVKDVGHDFRVSSVARSRVMTMSPRALFDVT